MRKICWLAILQRLIILVAPVAFSPSDANGAEHSQEIGFGPIEVTEKIENVPITSTLMAYFSTETDQGRTKVQCRVRVNLHDLQAKFGTIVETIPWPRDNCKGYRVDNLVVDLPKKQLAAGSDRGVIHIGGKVDVWTCLENPVPNSKVEWQMKKVGPVKTKVPVVKTWPGSPIKTKVAEQPFEFSVPVFLRKRDGLTLAIEVGDPSIELHGQFAFITKGALSIAGVNLNHEAKKRLEGRLGGDRLVFSLPKDFLDLKPEIISAGFVNDHDALTGEILLHATVTAETMTAFVKTLLEAKKP